MSTLVLLGDAQRIPLASQSVDLVVGSPPYMDARVYKEDGKDIGIARLCREWVQWMLAISAEALRVSRGPVLWVIAGRTVKRTYQPGPEGLAWRWYDEGWTELGPGTAKDGSSYRPLIWHRSSIPGSGAKEWYRADTEYILCFKRPGRLAYANPTANGHPPKWVPGGEMSHRLSDGSRRNQWGGTEKSGTSRRANGNREPSGRPSHKYMKQPNGSLEQQSYVNPTVANPGNVLRTTVGGGQMGHSLAHDNEAPYPVDVPAFLIRGHCPPGGLVLDPFGGSGTTLHAGIEEGRQVISMDLRPSQCRLTQKRRRSVQPKLPMFTEETDESCGS